MKKLHTVALATIMMGTASFAHALTVDLKKYGAVKYYEQAYAKMKEEGITPSKAFQEIYKGIQEGNTVFENSIVLASVSDFIIPANHRITNERN